MMHHFVLANFKVQFLDLLVDISVGNCGSLEGDRAKGIKHLDFHSKDDRNVASSIYKKQEMG